MNLFDAIFVDLCADPRIPDGVFDPSNMDHIYILHEILTVDYKFPYKESISACNALIINEEGRFPERQAYNKDGILVTFPTPKHKQRAIQRGTHFEENPLEKEETKPKEDKADFEQSLGKEKEMDQSDSVPNNDLSKKTEEEEKTDSDPGEIPEKEAEKQDTSNLKKTSDEKDSSKSRKPFNKTTPDLKKVGDDVPEDEIEKGVVQKNINADKKSISEPPVQTASVDDNVDHENKEDKPNTGIQRNKIPKELIDIYKKNALNILSGKLYENKNMNKIEDEYRITIEFLKKNNFSKMQAMLENIIYLLK